MIQKDEQGHALSGADGEAAAAYAAAQRQFSCYVGDPVGTIDAAIARRPDFVMAHAMRAYLFLLGAEPAGFGPARESYAAARRAAADDRERGHLTAIRHFLDGNLAQAARTLEDVAIAHPTDLLALQAGQLTDFLIGDSRMLRDRIARALPAWRPGMPGYHAVLGMHAFGLEETGLYARAEATGKRALEIEPRDGWAKHAVAHVIEMQCRPADGIRFMNENLADWAEDSFFSVHNWWHLALYHLELGDIATVLALYDDPAKIKGGQSPVIFDMLDASAMLWRLMLRGVDVGDRWRPLADAWEPYARSGLFAFNDAHAVMAFAGAGRHDLVEAVLAAEEDAIRGAGDNARITAEVGRPIALGLAAFASGDHRAALDLLRPVRHISNRFGGSHAQRDIVDLTMIEAALRAGEQATAAALVAERADLRPASPFTRLLRDRVETLPAAA
ncbi:tetratricopeptide repeat protein [Stella sp.]|uniref:tetratricopeptide repeat protein n=1 Tax=Stella sp. TaxID=2912054 RepID=UPI0035B1C367